MSETKFFTVTEVCRRLGIEPHVLRYWEKEFEISVKRNSAGRRIYSVSQVERLQTIKHLVRREKLTSNGARRQLARMKSDPEKTDPKDRLQALLWLKKELISIKSLLEQGP